VANCSTCGYELRVGAKFCDSCGAKIEAAVPKTAEIEGSPEPVASEDEGLGLSMHEDETEADLESTDEGGAPDSAPASDVEGASDLGSSWSDTESEAPVDAPSAEEEPPAELPKAGYLIFPDNTEQPLSPSQWLIGRADLTKFLPDPSKANEISRGHLTVFQDGDKYFIEDGTTMVQRKRSTNKTWLIRGASRILVTGNGRNELQHEDEIDVAELVRLQFVMR
jgi:hypothetical protein